MGIERFNLFNRDGSNRSRRVEAFPGGCHSQVLSSPFYTGQHSWWVTGQSFDTSVASRLASSRFDLRDSLTGKCFLKGFFHSHHSFLFHHVSHSDYHFIHHMISKSTALPLCSVSALRWQLQARYPHLFKLSPISPKNANNSQFHTINAVVIL